MTAGTNTNIIQVTNIAPPITKEQLKTFFGHVGHIEEITLYPEDDSANTQPLITKVAYIRFRDSDEAAVSLHLTNTVFVDKALIIVPVNSGAIPGEVDAMKIAAPANAAAGLMPKTSDWPSDVVTQITGQPPDQVITTIDPRLVQLSLPQYPPLPGNTDPTKIEEIRRTIYISSLDPSVSAESLLAFFSQVGEIMYIRMAGNDTSPSAYVEFTQQQSIPTALTYNRVMFAGKSIQIQHSLNYIVKPLKANTELEQKEVEEAMRKVKEAHNLISAAVDSLPDFGSGSKKSRSRSRSRTRRSRRSRSRSHSRRRRRSRSRSSRRRRRSRSRHRDRRSRSRSRRRSRSPVRRRRSRRSRSRSKHRRRRDSDSTDDEKRKKRTKRRSRSRSKDRSARRRHRSKSRDKSRSPDSADERRRRRKKEKEREKDKDRDRERGKDRKSSSDKKTSSPSTGVKIDYDEQEQNEEKNLNSTSNETNIDDKSKDVSPRSVEDHEITSSPQENGEKKDRMEQDTCSSVESSEAKNDTVEERDDELWNDAVGGREKSEDDSTGTGSDNENMKTE